MTDQKPRRRKASDMGLMPIAEQQELRQRLANRRDVEEAVIRLMAAFDEFLNHDEAMIKAYAAQFQAKGYYGQYHQNPKADAERRALAAKVKARAKETPLNWMGAVELSYNLRRMTLMTEFLKNATQEDASLQDIIAIYEDIGGDIRQRIHNDMGHWPEEFPVPDSRLADDESDNLFEIIDHQPKLF